MIRHATIGDVPALVEMGREFWAMSPHRTMGEFTPEAVSAMLVFLIADDKGLVLVNGEGAIGGMMAPIYFDPSKMMIEELFFWSHRGGRELLREFTERSKAMGASCVFLSALENERLPAVNRLFAHAGFRPLERRFVMEF